MYGTYVGVGVGRCVGVWWVLDVFRVCDDDDHSVFVCVRACDLQLTALFNVVTISSIGGPKNTRCSSI